MIERAKGLEITATREQEKIIRTTEGYIRCGAVPGSGKTFSITGRMAYLIMELYVDPSTIVALTFTNKAANSMTGRLQKMIGIRASCFTGTFHAFCNRILREEIYRLSYPKTFTILDQKGQIDLIREVAGELQISLKDYTAKKFAEDIAKRKWPKDYVAWMADADKTCLLQAAAQAAEDRERVYFQYLLKQRDNYVLDFDDIMNFALYVLEQHPDALHAWQDRCQYILCDEYQDVNEKQEQLLKLLSGKFQNLTVVGDDDQCIYGWRGSKVDYMVHFHKLYAGAKDFYLCENFRSTPEIVAAANSLIRENQNRLKKEMYTHNPSGKKPVFYQAKSERDEAIWIADTVLEAVGNGGSYAGHAVLVRASSQTRALEEAFIKKNVPYKIVSGAQFYSSEEIQTVLAYLRMVYAGNDLDFEWTIQRPRRGFGKKSMEGLKSDAKQKGLTLLEALGEQIAAGLVKKQAAVDYYQKIRHLQKTYEGVSAKNLVNQVLDLGYREELELDVDQAKLDNVSEFLETVAALERENQENIALGELLAHFALFSQQDDDTGNDVVRVMTIHTAKGLEFDTVFINGLVEGQFPSRRLQSEEELEEERRLFYVAITRAKKRLYLSSYDQKAAAFPVCQSGFLSDLDSRLLDCIQGSRIRGSAVMPHRGQSAAFGVGERVVHKVFGEGLIVSVDEKAQTYEIDFTQLAGTRRIQFRADLLRAESTPG